MPDSAWTETGSSISLVPVTSTIDAGSNPNNVNYLTNTDKIALIAQYAAELAMKTSLDALASTWSVSATAYNNAVAAINTTITGFSGAPSNWATIWPDGTTSGPWVGIQTLLSGDWATIAAQRAGLQAAISAAQAAAAQITAVNTAVAAAQPHVVSWAYASKPTLPSSSYPAGYYAITTDFRTVQVNAAGTTWVDILISANGLFGTLDAAVVSVINLNASNINAGTLTASYIYFSDGFCLNTLEPKESGANVTAAHVLTAVAASTATVTTTTAVRPGTSITGLAFSLNASGSTDVYNFFGSMLFGQTAGSVGNPAYINLYVDGVFNQASMLVAAAINPVSTPSYSFVMSLTGLTAGAHTLQFYLQSGVASNTFQVAASSAVLCQRIF